MEDIDRLRSTKQQYTNFPVFHGSTVVIADTQVPYQDGDFLLQILELAQAWNIRQGISGGDFLNQAAFSMFVNKPDDMLWREEKQAAMDVLTVMLKYIPHWLMILGNHDAYLLKRTSHHLGHEDIYMMMGVPFGEEKGISVTQYYKALIVDCEGNEWRVSHPRNISAIHGRVPTQLCSKFQQNIISGHGHIAGMSPDDSGKFIGVDIGVTCDPRRLDYSEERDNTRPTMNQGALLLKEGAGVLYPYHVSPLWTDWSAMRRLYPRRIL